ncbi:hypothetical protein [Kitasatospora sp. NPDC093102]|uniref:hypothetical protein n=1 Tax=Kitasatospora sp. NPDC093102 TaxID=3155069 RepID=UPI0034371FFA
MEFRGKAALAFGGVLLLAACSSGGSGGGGEAAPTASSASSGPADFGAALKDALDPISTELGKAGTAVDVHGAFELVGSRAARANRNLKAAAAPPAAEAARTELVTALDVLDTEATAISADYRDRKICTKGAAQARLGGGKGLAGVTAALAKLKAAGFPAAFTVPELPELPSTPRALDNGTLVRDGGNDGDGTVKVKNQYDTDVVFMVVVGDETLSSVYVAKGQEASIEGIKDGSYSFYYLRGQDWDSSEKMFSQGCKSVRFEGKHEFKPTGTTWTITLNPKAGGQGGDPAATKWQNVSTAPQA